MLIDNRISILCYEFSISHSLTLLLSLSLSLHIYTYIYLPRPAFILSRTYRMTTCHCQPEDFVTEYWRLAVPKAQPEAPAPP